MSHGATYRLDDQIGFLLRKANQRHIAIFAEHIGDLTPPQFAVLARLAEAGENRLGQNQLGTLAAMDAATIKGVVDRLHGRGLVELAKDDDDKRRLVVSLTDAGRDLVDRLVPHALQASRDTTEPLTPRETELLMRLLAKVG